MTAIKHSGDRGRRVAIKRLTQAAARLVSKQHKCVYMGEQREGETIFKYQRFWNKSIIAN